MDNYRRIRLSRNWTPIAFKRLNQSDWREMEPDIIIQARQDFDRGYIHMCQKKTKEGMTYLMVKKASDILDKPVKRKPYFRGKDAAKYM